MKPDTMPAWNDEDAQALIHRLLKDRCPMGCAFLDRGGRITGWSHGCAELTGFSSGEVVGTSFALLFTPEDVARQLPEHELETASVLGAAEDERWHMRKDGGRFWASGITVALGDAGQPSSFVKFFRDATPLRLRHEALENKLSSRRSEQKDQDSYLASIAHELRNPLQPMAIAIRLLTHPSEKNRHEQALKILDRQLGFLERLIEDLIDLTRVTHSKMAMTYVRVELQQLVLDAIESCRGAAEERNVALDCVLPPVAITVEVDQARITQVLVNLLNNAIKFTPSQGKVAVWATVDEGQFVVKVQDNGRGIEPQLQARIFDMFTQAAGASTGRGQGLGIGLALVKEIVSLHLGSVEVRSEGLGKGSEFFIRLPVMAPPHAATERAGESK